VSLRPASIPYAAINVQFLQLLQNLIGKRHQVSMAPKKPAIHVGATQTGSGNGFSTVSDNGIGIESESAENDFFRYSGVYIPARSIRGMGSAWLSVRRFVETARRKDLGSNPPKGTAAIILNSLCQQAQGEGICNERLRTEILVVWMTIPQDSDLTRDSAAAEAILIVSVSAVGKWARGHGISASRRVDM